MPVSPVSGRFDAFEWRGPMERLGHMIESRGDDHEDETRVPAILVAAPVVEANEPAETVKPQPVDAEKPDKADEAIDSAPVTPDAEPVDLEPASGPEPARLPDDPGVEPVEDDDKPQRRFRLF